VAPFPLMVSCSKYRPQSVQEDIRSVIPRTSTGK
jgi:hypothetical protein